MPERIILGITILCALFIVASALICNGVTINDSEKNLKFKLFGHFISKVNNVLNT